MKSRPTKQKLKQRGILKERVFGCDLGEHLLNSGFEGKHEIYNLIISVSNLSLLISCNQLDTASSTCSVWVQQHILNALRYSPDFGVTENHEGSRHALWHKRCLWSVQKDEDILTKGTIALLVCIIFMSLQITSSLFLLTVYSEVLISFLEKSHTFEIVYYQDQPPNFYS